MTKDLLLVIKASSKVYYSLLILGVLKTQELSYLPRIRGSEAVIREDTFEIKYKDK